MTARERDPQGASGPTAAARLEAIREACAYQRTYNVYGICDACRGDAEDHAVRAAEDIAWLLARLAPATPSGAAPAEHSEGGADPREERTHGAG